MSRRPTNVAALHLAIEKKRLEVDDRQILTRSQAELDSGLTAVAELQMQAKALDKELEGVEANIVNLNLVHTRLTDQRQDVGVLLRAKLDQVHALQTAGVSVD